MSGYLACNYFMTNAKLQPPHTFLILKNVTNTHWGISFLLTICALNEFIEWKYYFIWFTFNYYKIIYYFHWFNSDDIIHVPVPSIYSPLYFKAFNRGEFLVNSSSEWQYFDINNMWNLRKMWNNITTGQKSSESIKIWILSDWKVDIENLIFLERTLSRHLVIEDVHFLLSHKPIK